MSGVALRQIVSARAERVVTATIAARGDARAPAACLPASATRIAPLKRCIAIHYTIGPIKSQITVVVKNTFINGCLQKNLSATS